MSWDNNGSTDFQSNDFSSGTNAFANGDFGGGDASFSGGDASFGGGGGGGAPASRPGDWDCPKCSISNFASRRECFKCGSARPEGLGGDDRPPRPEPTEEQMAHRNYNWASNRARYEFNENAIDENGMAPRNTELENELFEENSGEQQTQLDFAKYKKIPVRVERGAAPQPIKTVSYFVLTTIFYCIFITKNNPP